MYKKLPFIIFALLCAYNTTQPIINWKTTCHKYDDIANYVVNYPTRYMFIGYFGTKAAALFAQGVLAPLIYPMVKKYDQSILYRHLQVNMKDTVEKAFLFQTPLILARIIYREKTGRLFNNLISVEFLLGCILIAILENNKS